MALRWILEKPLEDMDCTELAQETDSRAFVPTVMNLWAL